MGLHSCGFLCAIPFPVQPGWYLSPQKIPVAENWFLQAGKGAENTKEKSRQCFKMRARWNT
jgi:hypothetical protein